MDVWQEARKKIANYSDSENMAEQTHNPNPPVSEGDAAKAQAIRNEEDAVEKVKAMLSRKQERRRII